MAEAVKYIYGTEAQILALTPTDESWEDRAFYYPNDRNYFYQALDGVMNPYGKGDNISIGVGVRLNGAIIGGVKNFIESEDLLEIPLYFDYNSVQLRVEGNINCTGQINIL